MALPESLYLEKRPRWTRRQWVILGCGIFGLTVLVPAVAIFLPIWDIAPVDDSEMWISPTPISEDLNAWPILENIYRSIPYNERSMVSNWVRNQDEEIVEGKAWLEKTRLMEDFHKLSAYPACRPPFGQHNEHGDIYVTILYFAHKLSRLNLHTQQSSEERYEAWQLYLNFLKQWENPKTGSYSPLFRRQATNDMLVDLLQDPFLPTFSDEKLETLLEKIIQQDADLSDDWMWALLLDYQYQHRTFSEGGWEGYWEEFYGRLGHPAPNFARWPVFPFVYQPNRTQAWILESYQAALTRVAPAQFDFPSARDIEQIMIDDFTPEGIGWVAIIFNLYGLHLLYDLSAPGFNQLDGHTHENTWNVQAAQLYVSLILHQRTNGTLPDVLPGNLVDPFDGNPIRYQPAQRRFYSVGWNGIDEGGLDTGRSRSGDIVVELPELK